MRSVSHHVSLLPELKPLYDSQGYVNELLARLTAGPVHLGASVNATLDSALSTFPLNRTIYVDFSHDNDMVRYI